MKSFKSDVDSCLFTTKFAFVLGKENKRKKNKFFNKVKYKRQTLILKFLSFLLSYFFLKTSLFLCMPTSNSSILIKESQNKEKEKEKEKDLRILYKISIKNPILTTLTSLILIFSFKKIWLNFGKRIKNSDYLIENWLNKNGIKKLNGVCTRLV